MVKAEKNVDFCISPSPSGNEKGVLKRDALSKKSAPLSGLFQKGAPFNES
jgi:hypothetical protein